MSKDEFQNDIIASWVCEVYGVSDTGTQCAPTGGWWHGSLTRHQEKPTYGQVNSYSLTFLLSPSYFSLIMCVSTVIIRVVSNCVNEL